MRAGTLVTSAGQKRKLRRALLLLFLTIAGLLAVLMSLSMQRLRDEAFLQQRFNAQQTAAAISADLSRVVDAEEGRPFDHYSHLITAAGVVNAAAQLQLSPLSALAVPDALPGLVGYFQIGSDGTLTSPLLPPAGLPGAASYSDYSQRRERFYQIEQILGQVRSHARDVQAARRDAGEKSKQETREKKEQSESAAAPAAAPKVSQEALLAGAADGSSGSVKGNALDRQFMVQQLKKALAEDQRLQTADQQRENEVDRAALMEELKDAPRKRAPRKESANLVALDAIRPLPAEPQSLSSQASVQQSPALGARITTFEAEVDPLQAALSGTRHLVLFRKAWRDNRRIIQGLILDLPVFLERIVESALTAGTLPGGASVLISFGDSPLLRVQQPQYDIRSSLSLRKAGAGKVSSQYLPTAPTGEILLFSAPLGEPLAGFDIFLSARDIPLPPGSFLLLTLSALLALTLAAGLLVIYRLGCTQIELAQKRSDFVSAVSHELKTPLTSIRMYGEMLRNGWVPDEARRRSYYDYIFQESERLSRLIANVLRFSRLTGTEEQLDMQQCDSVSLLSAIREKVEPLAAAAGFTLRVVPNEPTARISADRDALSQIAINLVDNAIKFCRDAERKEIEIGFRNEQASARAVFFVRDFGGGVPRAEQRRIFELFYRCESELTRKTSGTGIGLALVKELALRMGAKVDYRSRDPGAEFQISFPSSAS